MMMAGNSSRKTRLLGALRRNIVHVSSTTHPKVGRTERKTGGQRSKGRKRGGGSKLAERSVKDNRVTGRKRKTREEADKQTERTEKRRRLHRNHDNKWSASNSGGSDTESGSLHPGGYRSVEMEEVADVRHTSSRTMVHDAGDGERAAFEAKYKETYPLGNGGCASVFAGYSKVDYEPVAIKHIPKNKMFCSPVRCNRKMLPAEVAIMQKLMAKKKVSMGTLAPVMLFDWYDLDQEIIMVLERPVPAQDLSDYKKNNGCSLKEEEAKTILKQLVDAAIALAQSHIFHRDIKAENILIETGSGVPRVRLIDFGLSCFVKKRSRYTIFYGTPHHVTPEWCRHSVYRPGPTTVWQLGIVLFEMIHRKRFDTKLFLYNQLDIRGDLSEHCIDFLHACLHREPGQRLTLKELKRHPWLL